jgi:hypothetical protein
VDTRPLRCFNAGPSVSFGSATPPTKVINSRRPWLQLIEVSKLAYSIQRAFLLLLLGVASCWRPLSSRCFWPRPMRPARQIWRPTAAQTFFEGEEELHSWPKLRVRRRPGLTLNAPGRLKVRLGLISGLSDAKHKPTPERAYLVSSERASGQCAASPNSMMPSVSCVFRNAQKEEAPTRG